MWLFCTYDHFCVLNLMYTHHIFQLTCHKLLNNQHWAIWHEFETVDLPVLRIHFGVGWDLLPTLRWLGSWLPTYLIFLGSSREKISRQQSNRQPFHLKMGTSPLSPGSLGSSRTQVTCHLLNAHIIPCKSTLHRKCLDGTGLISPSFSQFFSKLPLS